MDAFWNKIQFSENNVSVGMHAENKQEALEKVIGHMLERQKLPVSSGYLLKKIMEREKKGSTGMQDGIAFPHLRSDCTDKFLVEVGIFPKGVDFDSLDQKPTKIIILSLVPEEMVDEQLRYLAKMSTFFSSMTLRNRIIESGDNTEIYRLLCDNT